MTIFDHSNYKEYIKKLIAQMPRKGRGQLSKLAQELTVNSTVISQIFKGDRHLSPEQGLKVSKYFGFNELEEKYFITLIHKERAGTKNLSDFYKKEEKKLLLKAQQVKTRIQKHKVISEEHKAQFYSEWYYSGIRMLSALPTHNTIDDFADYFNLNRGLVTKVLDLLISTGLCIEENGRISVGPQNTHIDNKSLFVNSHRRNWKLKSLQAMNNNNDSDLFYSSPMSLSKEDRLKIREELLQAIDKVLKKVHKSKEEELVCLNIDWFKF